MTLAERLQAATQRQVEAADPRACTWLSANAGSGKTRVLTDRVARLLLDDAPPQNILCLTYTKAAASEMQNRLFERLGAWAMLPDERLAHELRQLETDRPTDPETLAKARRLFARAIETPGGLKIQTIHSFCAAVLRRFPLEAGLTPGFTEMDDNAQADLRDRALARVVQTDPDLFRAMATMVSDQDMATLCAEIVRHRAAFPVQPHLDGAREAAGLPAGYSEAEACARVMDDLTLGDLSDLADVLANQTKTAASFATALRDAVKSGMDRIAIEGLVAQRLITKEFTISKNALSDKRLDELGHAADLLYALIGRLRDATDDFKALAVADMTLTLHRFAAAYLPVIDAEKATQGWLDFDDLIALTDRLLSRPGVADWVLYRLDGGIDHILVDEAQDTSPQQWRVIERLTREMTAGEGAERPADKTLFVVGDLKQSIYSFQGADPEGFSTMRDTFGRRLGEVGQRLQQLNLEFSFRSAAPILATVDQTFAEARAGLEGAVLHRAFHQDMPGRVDLWPIVEPTETGDGGDWTDPVDRVAEDHHTVKMARRVADECARMIDEEVLWEADKTGGYHPRQITCGDILILVQGRQALFHELIAACKARGLDVAGADVLPLGEELAFKDLIAVLAFLATPEDDLSLAAALKSPLFGWDDAQLYDLAAERPGFLWQALRAQADRHPETLAILDDLRAVADFHRPYDLIERILTRHRGRARLIGRLGPEAADGIDALLTQALDYEQTEAPSLTGFLAAMEGAEINVRRRAEGRGSKIRVMTVHGSKGLESPIVFLPDCGTKVQRGQIKDHVLPTEDGPPVWRPKKDEASAHIDQIRDGLAEAKLDEGQRLLYVAMTRAKQWLIVGAAGRIGDDGDSWWERIATGLGALEPEAQPFQFSFGTGTRYAHPRWDSNAKTSAPTSPTAEVEQPLGLAAEVAPPPIPADIISPSGLGGAKALAGEGGQLSEAAALERGTHLHLLLEHLPGAPDREALARQLLPETANIAELLSEAEAVLATPALASLFAPDTLAEVPISGAAGPFPAVYGVIDRLIVTPQSVLAVDFKSNAVVPASAETVPEGLLRQMGAYAALLAPLYPGRTIETALLWTATLTLMMLPATLTEAALARAAHEGVKDVTPG